ncbi:MAG: hypothetical protein Q8O53_00705 [Candidatus Moranbacteria bacterium]|nr:hypothetical protein [Candidatus Moranbacteria bacterium]
MKDFLKRIFGIKPAQKRKSDFSAFFYDASEEEQKDVLMRVMKKANADQRKVIEKYDEQLSHAR